MTRGLEFRARGRSLIAAVLQTGVVNGAGDESLELPIDQSMLYIPNRRRCRPTPKPFTAAADAAAAATATYAHVRPVHIDCFPRECCTSVYFWGAACHCE